MDLRQLRYFAAIVEEGSFSAAAGRLNVAQSALSLHVKRLEQRFGLDLLVRQHSGVRPTEAGVRLLDHARLILAQVRAAERDLQAAVEQPAGAVTIGIPAGVGRVLNGPLLEAARSELPNVSLEIVEVLPTIVGEWLADGLIRLGLRYELERSSAVGDILAEEQLYLVSGKRLPRWDNGLSLADLAGIPLIMPTCTPNPAHCIATYAAGRGIALDIAARVDSLATILELVMAQPGQAVLTAGAFLNEWRQGKLFAYPLVPPVRRFVLLSAGAETGTEPAVEAVRGLVMRKARSLLASGAWPERLPIEARSAA